MDNFFVNMLLILYNNIKCTTMQFMKIISKDSKISGSKIRFFFLYKSDGRAWRRCMIIVNNYPSDLLWIFRDDLSSYKLLFSQEKFYRF